MDLDAAVRGDIAETSMAFVVIKKGSRSLKIIGLAVGPGPAVDFIAHFRVDLLRPPDVVPDEQIQLSVVVVIQPGRAGAPVVRRTAHAGVRGRFLDRKSTRL